MTLAQHIDEYIEASGKKLKLTQDDLAGMVDTPWAADRQTEAEKRMMELIKLWYATVNDQDPDLALRLRKASPIPDRVRSATLTTYKTRIITTDSEGNTITQETGQQSLGFLLEYLDKPYTLRSAEELDALLSENGYDDDELRALYVKEALEITMPPGAATSIITAEFVHETWEQVRKYDTSEDIPQHPLAPLIDGCLERPPIAEADSRNTAIAPAPLNDNGAIYIKTDISEMGALFDLSELERASTPTPSMQAYLPGVAPQPNTIITPLPFLIWDGNDKEGRGRGAPYGLRMWNEYVWAVPIEKRDRARIIALAWGDLVDGALGRRGDKRSQARLWAALSEVHNLRLVHGNPGSLTARAAVMVQDMPLAWNQYDALVKAIIELPPGSGVGPIVYKPHAREIARQTAAGYRGYLSLCYFWDRYGATKGRYIQATRPLLFRDNHGLLLNKRGQALVDKNGTPVTSWTVTRNRNGEIVREMRSGVVPLGTTKASVGPRLEPVPTLQLADRERNPQADRYPILSADDLVRLCYPPDWTDAKKLTRSARSMRRERAREVLGDLADKGYFILEEADDGVRILPAQKWGANYRDHTRNW